MNPGQVTLSGKRVSVCRDWPDPLHGNRAQNWISPDMGGVLERECHVKGLVPKAKTKKMPC